MKVTQGRSLTDFEQLRKVVNLRMLSKLLMRFYPGHLHSIAFCFIPASTLRVGKLDSSARGHREECEVGSQPHTRTKIVPTSRLNHRRYVVWCNGMLLT